jgi:hypothetical protein
MNISADDFVAGKEATMTLTVKSKIVPCDPRVFQDADGKVEVFRLEITSNGGYTACHFVTTDEARGYYAEHEHL